MFCAAVAKFLCFTLIAGECSLQNTVSCEKVTLSSGRFLQNLFQAEAEKASGADRLVVSSYTLLPLLVNIVHVYAYSFLLTVTQRPIILHNETTVFTKTH